MLYNEILKYVHIVLCSNSQLVIQKCWEIVEIMENVERSLDAFKQFAVQMGRAL